MTENRMTGESKTIQQIRDLENSFCNPMKLKFSLELRQDLAAQGHSPQQIERMVNGDD